MREQAEVRDGRERERRSDRERLRDRRFRMSMGIEMEYRWQCNMRVEVCIEVDQASERATRYGC